jgi:hypothetical protein
MCCTGVKEARCGSFPFPTGEVLLVYLSMTDVWCLSRSGCFRDSMRLRWCRDGMSQVLFHVAEHEGQILPAMRRRHSGGIREFTCRSARSALEGIARRQAHSTGEARDADEPILHRQRRDGARRNVGGRRGATEDRNDPAGGRSACSPDRDGSESGPIIFDPG